MNTTTKKFAGRPDSDPKIELNPFPGLRPFREDEEYLFFGRESQVDAMVDKLAATHFLAVVGTSGSGKSSLVNCGLRPALHGGLMSPAGTVWRMAQFRPGNNPLKAMAQALAEDDVLFSDYQSADGAMTLAEIVDTTLRMSKLGLIDIYEQSNLDKNANLLIVVDQFEELFRYRQLGADEQENLSGGSEEDIAFVNLLLEAKEQTKYPIYVVLTMRSDFLGDCAHFPGLVEAINAGQYLVPRMNRDERRSAIRGPVGVGGAQISPVLLTRLVNDVGDNPDQLSILQHALNRTWYRWQKEGRADKSLDLPHYEAIGTMTHALDQHAEESYAELETEREQQICEKIFKALTDKATDPRGVRRPTILADLCALAEASEEEVTKVINVFRQPKYSFLMPPVGDTLRADTVIDISHESLMRVWERLKKWADEEAQSARIYRRLAETATLNAVGKAGLWHDPDLQVALEWQETNRPNKDWARRYNPDFENALAFLQASEQKRADDEAEREQRQKAEIERAQREQQLQASAETERQRANAQLQIAAEQQQRLEQQARHAIRMRRMLGALTVVLLLALASTVFAFNAYQIANAASIEAEKQKQIAENEKAEAVKSAREADEQRQIAIAAGKTAETERSKSVKEKENAEKQKQIAENEKAEAEIARADAEKAKTVAIKEKEKAEIAKIAADKEKKKAEVQKQIAEDQKAEADKQRLRADRFNYLANMNLAGQALTANNWPRVNDLLNYFLPPDSGGKEVDGKGNEDDPRSFYWYSLWHYSHNELSTLKGHSDKVVSVAFSPDGITLASASWDNTVNLWTLQNNGKWEPKNTLKGHKDWVKSVAFSRDGTLASASKDKTVKLWNVSTGQELATLSGSIGHSDKVNSVAFSPDGSTLASASDDTTVKLWTLKNGKWQYKDTLEGHKDRVVSVAFSPDGKTLASASNDGTVRLWNLSTPSESLPPLPDDANSVAFSPDGETLASASYKDKEVKLWPLKNGKWQQTDTPKALKGDSRVEDVVSVSFSPVDKTLLASASTEGTVKLWKMENGKWEPKNTLKGHSDTVVSVAFSRDGTLASASWDKTVKLWDTGTRPELSAPSGQVYSVLKHENRVNSVAFSPVDKTLLASASSDKTVKLWVAGTGQELDTLSESKGGHSDKVNSVAFSPDGSTLASASDDTTVKLWTLQNGKWQYKDTLEGHKDRVVSVAFSPDGTLASASEDKTVKLWIAGTGQLLTTLDDDANSVAFSADGRTLASASKDTTVKLWTLQNNGTWQQTDTLKGHSKEVNSVAFSRDGTLASGSQDSNVKLWDVNTGKELDTLKADMYGVASVAFSPDGKTLASASYNDYVKLWDTDTWKELATLRHSEYSGVNDAINSVAFSPDGNTLASANWDSTVNLWIAAPDKEVAAQIKN